MYVFFPMCPAQVVLEEVFSGSSCKLCMVNLFPAVTIPVIRNLVYRTGLFLPPVQNVLTAAVMLAITIGFKEIYLIGADHSWHQDVTVGEDNHMYLIHRHFNRASKPLPMYNRPHEPRRPMRVDEWLFLLRRTFRSYHFVAEYARHRGANIYNATPGSFIDAFPRRRLSSMMTGSP
jgi:hypothetical protein